MKYKEAQKYILNRLKEELPDTLTYHGVEHSLSVIEASKEQAQREDITEIEQQLLLTAAAYHDSGFLYTYRNHEIKSCALVEECLPQFDYSIPQIERIKGMIMATKIPQDPQTQLEHILCDADLHYLGEDNYQRIAQSLRDELVHNGIKLNSEEWLNLQIKFLEEHHYWTDYYREIMAPRKERVLEGLRTKL